MKVEGTEVLQLLIPNFNLKDILKPSFLEDINEKHDGTVRIVGLNIALSNKDKTSEKEKTELITLSHINPNYEKENKIVLDVRNPEKIDMMLEIIKKHQNEG
ncbi:MAG: hypothetical protein K8E24_005095 [Methanobacterium paludis]|nr:hypothetical protein [Methanobacterium paludis]